MLHIATTGDQYDFTGKRAKKKEVAGNLAAKGKKGKKGQPAPKQKVRAHIRFRYNLKLKCQRTRR